MILRFLKAIWRFLSGVSRVISVLVPLVFVGVFITAFSLSLGDAGPKPLPDKAALLIAPSGALVEDAPAPTPLAALFNQEYQQPTVLQDIISAIRWAAEDDRISAVVLDLENVSGPTTSQTVEISAAIAEFKDAGKPVIARADFYSQANYLLAAQADQVLLHPEGGLFLEGFSVYRAYLRTFLERVRVTMHVFRAGDNKSAVEPYLRDDMSDGEREVITRWLTGLWSAFTGLAESGRGMPLGSMDAFIAAFPEKLNASENDLAETLLAAGWIDVLADHAEMDAALIKWVGAEDEAGLAPMVNLEQYQEALATRRSETEQGLPLIAIVPVEGTLVPGESEEGMAGSDTITHYIETALEADALAAMVLRVNSPGGSVFASEQIRRKLFEVRERGIPLVVSMGSVAASGGYWIAAEADEIWALPTTITGSIGAFSAFPTIEGVFDYIGVTVDGLGTTSLAGAASFERGLSPEMASIVQALSVGAYQDFVQLVADGRGMTREAVEQVADGLVWTGQEAAMNGLVDGLGGLDEAVAAAASLAGVEQWRTRRTSVPPSFESLFIEELSRSLTQSVLPKGAWFQALANSFTPVVKSVSSLRDPAHLYVQCLLCAPLP
ncbi:signal peptide peptidase SppA [Luminiphilus sp.]|nr:signal peptide peptidase SppA [Luminiphilus sp.]